MDTMEDRKRVFGVSIRGWLICALAFLNFFVAAFSKKLCYAVVFIMLFPVIIYEIVEAFRSRSFSREKDFWIFLFFVAWIFCVSLLYRRVDSGWILTLWYLCICWFFIALVPRQMSMSDLKKDIFIAGLVIICAFLPFYWAALASVFTGRLMNIPFFRHPVGIQAAGAITQPVVVTTHYNTDARIAASILLFSIYGFIVKRKLWPRVFFCVAILTATLFLAHTQSRTVYISLSLALGMIGCRWVYLRFVGRKWRIPVGVVAAAAVFFLALNGLTLIFNMDMQIATRLQSGAESVAVEAEDNPLVSRVETEGQFAMFSNGRDIIWKGVLSFLKDHPRYFLTGIGGSDDSAFDLVQEEITGFEVYAHCHNSYLAVLMVGGIPLLLAVLAYLVLLLKPCLRVFFRETTEENRGLFIVPAFILMYLAIAVPEHIIFVRAYNINLLFFLFCGAIMHDDRLHRQSCAEKR